MALPDASAARLPFERLSLHHPGPGAAGHQVLQRLPLLATRKRILVRYRFRIPGEFQLFEGQ